MLEKIKTYLSIEDDTLDSLLNILIENAVDAFEVYTNASAADNQSIILKMVVEDYNRKGSEGISSLSFGSGSESVLEDYSVGLQKLIRRQKKARVL